MHELPPPPAIVHEIVISERCEIDHQEIAWKHLADMSDEELDSDLKLDEFFGSIYVVNLPQAEERLKRITAEMEKIGLRHFQVWKATYGRNPDEVPEAIWSKMNLNWRHLDPSNPEGLKALHHQFQGEAGCFLSHYRLLKHVQERFQTAMEDLRFALEQQDSEGIGLARERVKKYSTVLVMEDDNCFGYVNSDKRSATLQGLGRHLREALAELPHDWDMIYFMTMSKKPASAYTPHLKKLTYGCLTNAYAISYRMFDKMIDQLKRIEDPNVTSLQPVDDEMAQLHASNRCFAIKPSIAYQAEGATFIVGWVYDWLRQVQP